MQSIQKARNRLKQKTLNSKEERWNPIKMQGILMKLQGSSSEMYENVDGNYSS